MTDDEIAAMRVALKDADPDQVKAMAEMMGRLAELIDQTSDEVQRALLLAAPNTTEQ